jgi:hypothetical protein
MKATVEFAGFFAAHAIWNVSEGGPLVPLLVYTKSNFKGAKQEMVRLAMEPYEAAVAYGREVLTKNEQKAVRAVLIYDGYVTLPGGKTDALVLEIRKYSPRGLLQWRSGPTQSLTMAVPYRDVGKPGGFAVFRPKLLSDEGGEAAAFDLGQAFFRGVDQHKKGAAVWNNHLDQSQ